MKHFLFEMKFISKNQKEGEEVMMMPLMDRKTRA